jgi:hypothetical protein
MNGGKLRALGLLLGLGLVVGLPVLGSWTRRPAAAGCALDGMKVDPAYRVEVVDADGRAHEFCCPNCAAAWLSHQAAPPRSVTATDEATGEPVNAAAAWYVRSSVTTAPVAGNRTHVFRDRGAAERHAAAYAGRVLSASDNPLRRAVVPGARR